MNALNYLGFYGLLVLMPFFAEDAMKDQDMVGARFHFPASMPKHYQICLRLSEHICPLGIPSLATRVFANSSNIVAIINKARFFDIFFLK